MNAEDQVIMTIVHTTDRDLVPIRIRVLVVVEGVHVVQHDQIDLLHLDLPTDRIIQVIDQLTLVDTKVPILDVMERIRGLLQESI